MDPDQDLLDKLDRQEGLDTLPNIILGGGLAAIAGAIAYLTLKMELNASGEAAVDAGILIFIISAMVLTLSYLRFR